MLRIVNTKVVLPWYNNSTFGQKVGGDGDAVVNLKRSRRIPFVFWAIIDPYEMEGCVGAQYGIVD